MKNKLIQAVVYIASLGIITWLISPKTHTAVKSSIPSQQPSGEGLTIILVFIVALVILIVFLKKSEKKSTRSFLKNNNKRSPVYNKTTAMGKIEELEITLLVKYNGKGVKEKDVIEFISFENGASCSIPQDNPFVSENSDARIVECTVIH